MTKIPVNTMILKYMIRYVHLDYEKLIYEHGYLISFLQLCSSKVALKIEAEKLLRIMQSYMYFCTEICYINYERKILRCCKFNYKGLKDEREIDGRS
jgi:hypothetical protein